jgi:membrane protein
MLQCPGLRRNRCFAPALAEPGSAQPGMRVWPMPQYRATTWGMSSPLKISPTRLWSALRAAAIRFNTHGGWVMSSHVAMSMMLAIFPFLLFVVALTSALTPEVGAEDLIDLVFGSWPEEISAPIVAEIRAVLRNSDLRLMTVGGLLALYFASNGVNAVRAAMTSAYRDTDSRPFWRARLTSVTFVLFAGLILSVLAMVSLALPLYVELVAKFMPDAGIGRAFSWVTSAVTRRLLPLGLMVVAVTACHLWLPPVRHTLARIWPGVVLTLLLWWAAGLGFSLYVTRFSSYGATYAGLAGAMAALIFLYLMGAILILGAELNGALGRQAAPDTA